MAILESLRALDQGSYEPPIDVLKWGGCRYGDRYVRILVKDLDLDTDGKNSGVITHWDIDHQDETSYDPSGEFLSSDLVPYVVLPRWLAALFSVALGDIVGILDGDNVSFGVFADVGPSHKIGEASIQMHRMLGHEVVKDGQIRDESLDRPVRYLILPGVNVSLDELKANDNVVNLIQNRGSSTLDAIISAGAGSQ